MVYGEFNHSIDTKSRMFLPAKLREQFGDTVYLLRSIDTCISVYPLSAWNEFVEKVKSLPQVEAREVRRFLFASAVEVPIDTQGRVLIPQNLREYAHLDKNVFVIGVGEYAEIWDENTYKEKMNSLRGDEMASKLIELGF